MGIIFDLDQTLVNSLDALELRRNRRWSEVYSIIPYLRPFDGIENLIEVLQQNNIPICIVTSSPRSYCERIIKQWGWNNMHTVCYHDTKRHKPYPDPILKGVQKMGLCPSEVISVGDESKDIEASKKAGVMSVGALWGCTDKDDLIKKNPDFIFDTPDEFLKEILKGK
jgi:HAD superfamily hydrolase (TIGR01549 family)